MNEQIRVKQVLSGNTSAFVYFVDTYQDMAYTIAYRIIGNKQDAEDVVQESYLKAFRNLASFRSDSKFSTWLYRIVYNTAVTQAKAQMWQTARETNIDDAFYLTDEQSARIANDKETKEIVSLIMDQLPKGDALLLTLYYMDDHSVKEIATITGLNESNVKVKLFRARKLFKELLMNEINSISDTSITESEKFYRYLIVNENSII
ncbi:MAG: RNA polymerase sigma factor [Dysgonamonadaceae bacterium]